MGRAAYDAVIVGGGHNGLVAGFYLARAGLRTLVLERRPFVGGACNTEEFAPGFRASTGAYVLSMLRESIWHDMRLVQRGIVVDAAGPTLNLYPDGASYTVGDDMAANVEATRRFSSADARALPRFEDDLERAGAGGAALLRLDGTRSARAIAVGSGGAGEVGAHRPAPAQAPGRPRVPVLDEREPVPVGAVRERSREGRARLARDQRQRGRAVDAGHRVRAAARSRERGDRRRGTTVGVRARRHGRAHRDDGRRGARGRMRGPMRRRGRTGGHARGTSRRGAARRR